MDIEKVKELITTLEENIKISIKLFEDNTGLTVDGISLIKEHLIVEKYPRTISVDVSVHI